jgi:hypothetical protein
LIVATTKHPMPRTIRDDETTDRTTRR